MDAAKLLGEWLLAAHRVPMYLRLLPSVVRYAEATELICAQPCTPARLLRHARAAVGAFRRRHIAVAPRPCPHAAGRGTGPR